MGMTLLELQDVLGDRIKVALKENISVEERQTDNAQSAIIVGLAKQMINNGDLILRTEKLAAQSKSLKESAAMKLIAGTFRAENEKVSDEVKKALGN